MVVVDTAALAKGYTTLNTTQSSAGLFLLSHLSIGPSSHVLDVGCGPGNLTQHISQLVGPSGVVVGIDPSPERIRLALQLAGAPSLSFHEGRAEDLSRFGDASLDVVYVNSTFHWVGDQARAMREFARVLRPGGQLGISGGSGDFVATHERIKADVLSRAPYASYAEESPPRFLKRREMEDLLDEAGLRERRFVINSIVKEARDGEEMIDWLDTSSSGKTYGGIPVEMRPRAREEMIKEWRQYETEDGIKMDMELLVTVAVKR